jgi:hypothetical protein
MFALVGVLAEVERAGSSWTAPGSAGRLRNSSAGAGSSRTSPIAALAAGSSYRAAAASGRSEGAIDGQ